MLLEKVKGMDDGCYHVRVIFLSWVELSFHLFLPFAQRRIEFQKTHQQKLGWSWLGGEIFPRVKLVSSLLVPPHQSMIHPDPAERPSAAALAKSRVLCPSLGKTEELQHQLNLEKFKTATLER